MVDAGNDGRMDPVDEVLLEFMTAYDVPSEENVREFQARYPEFADEIAENADETVRYHREGGPSMVLTHEPGDEELAWGMVAAFHRRHPATDRRAG